MSKQKKNHLYAIWQWGVRKTGPLTWAKAKELKRRWSEAHGNVELEIVRYHA